MSVFVKICGLCSQEDVEAVAALKPDAMGFVFWHKSRRSVLPEEVAEWVRNIPASILRVGVFVDAPMADIACAVKKVGLDVVQLHGHESQDVCSVIPARVWKVVRLERDNLDVLGSYHVDAFLLDSYSAKSPGGTGRVTDWKRAGDFVRATMSPVILAGGLTPENVEQAIHTVRPWGVDVSSGVEEWPRKKDIKRVAQFIRQCRKE